MVYLIGDIHGNLSVISNLLSQYELTNSLLIQVGDFGYNLDYNDLEYLNYLLNKNNNILYIVRGNHDNYYNHYPTNLNVGDIPLKKYRNLNAINFTRDYSIFKYTNLGRVLIIGGAISVDRHFREINKSYWYEEGIKYDHSYLNLEEVDTIITHTAPIEFYPLGDTLSMFSYLTPKDKKDLIDERNYLSLYLKRYKPKYWIHGHFHTSLRYVYENTQVISLGESEIYEIRV